MSDLDAILSPTECKSRREALGLTFLQLSSRSGVSGSSIRAFEKGLMPFRLPQHREALKRALCASDARNSDTAANEARKDKGNG